MPKIVSAWARREERAFCPPYRLVSWNRFASHLFGPGPDIACSNPSTLLSSRTARQPHPLIRRGSAFLTCRHPSARQHAVIEILIDAACLSNAAGLMFHHGTLSPLLFKGHVGVDVGAGQPSVARASHQCQRHSQHRNVSHECPPHDGGEHSRFPVAPRKEDPKRRDERRMNKCTSQTASASRIRLVIASGCEINARWLAAISIVFAPIRLAMKRSRSGLIVRSWVDTA
jgi:hypothetical protein